MRSARPLGEGGRRTRRVVRQLAESVAFKRLTLAILKVVGLVPSF